MGKELSTLDEVIRDANKAISDLEIQRDMLLIENKRLIEIGLKDARENVNLTKQNDTLLQENAEYKKNIEYHKGKITMHWMESAYLLMKAGDGEKETLKDFGYAPLQGIQKVLDIAEKDYGQDRGDIIKHLKNLLKNNDK